MTDPDPTETMNAMRRTLKELADQRLKMTQRLGTVTNPDHRAELEECIVKSLEHEEMMRDMLSKIEFDQKMTPLLDEAAEALDTGDQTTIDDAMKWHAA